MRSTTETFDDFTSVVPTGLTGSTALRHCAYDKADGSCARVTCGGISHQHHEAGFSASEPREENGGVADPRTAPTDRVAHNR